MHSRLLIPAFLTALILIFSASISGAQSGTWVQLYESAQSDIEISHWAEAESALKVALPIAKNMDATDLRYAFTMGSLGRVYVSQDRLAEAEPLLLKAVDLLQKADYKDHELADFCLSYQDLLIKTGRTNDALQVNGAIKKLVTQKVAMQKAAADPWQVEYDLGIKRYGAKHYADCEPHLAKSLQIAKCQVGAADEVRKSTTALFALYRDQHRYSLIDVYFPQLRSLINKVKGAKSVAMASLLEEYSEILLQQKRLLESREWKMQAEAIYKDIAQRENPTSPATVSQRARTVSHFSFNSSEEKDFFSSPLTSSWGSSYGLGGSSPFLNTQAEAMRESYEREADIVAQKERNTRALESRQLQLQILHPSYMSRYYRH